MVGCWVFGYGSLVSPRSFGATLGRELRLGQDVFEAEVDGFGRRWNYGVMHTEGVTIGDDGEEAVWTIVALGVVPAVGESVNGVVCWVDDREIEALDRRERHYDRVDVTDRASVHGASLGAPVAADARIVTYVPRPEARRHHEAAREAGRAAIERRYWDLVGEAFTALGADRHERYRATTPGPDLPVLELLRRPVDPSP